MKKPEIENIKNRLRDKFISMAEPMKQVEFTRENYNRLFPYSRVSTPLGEVKIGEHQFEKLIKEDREYLLGPMSQTLKKPIVIFEETRDGKKALLYMKTFSRQNSDKIDAVISVIVDIKGVNVSISTHSKDINNLINRIKNPGKIVFEKAI